MVEDMGYSEGFVNIDEYNLHYLEWGKEGKGLILLHGSAPYCSAHDLQTIGDALRDARARAVEYPLFFRYVWLA